MRYTLIIATASLAACVNTISITTEPMTPPTGAVASVKAAIAHDLKDPSSARFREIVAYRTSAGDTIICGEVNAKNSYGAYAGFEPFYSRFRDGQMLVARLDALACSEAASGRMMVGS